MSEILPAVLGWSNPETAGGANVRLYARDQDHAPRWAADGGRTVERAIVERDGGLFEGDRYLVVRIGDRFVSDQVEHRIAAAVQAALEEQQPPCRECGPGYRIGDDGCRHGAGAGS